MADEPASSAEIRLVFLPVFRWVSLVFSVLLARLVMSVWMVVMSTHPMRPPGCGDGETRRVKVAGCRWPPQRDGKREALHKPGTVALGSRTEQGPPERHSAAFHSNLEETTKPNPILQGLKM